MCTNIPIFLILQLTFSKWILSTISFTLLHDFLSLLLFVWSVQPMLVIFFVNLSGLGYIHLVLFFEFVKLIDSVYSLEYDTLNTILLLLFWFDPICWIPSWYEYCLWNQNYEFVCIIHLFSVIKIHLSDLFLYS